MTVEEFKVRLVPYARKLYPLVRRILNNEEEVRDALQELMIKLWNKRDFLENCANAEGYIMTVARNFCFDIRKKQKVRKLESLDEARMTVQAPVDDAEGREKWEHIHRIIENLPSHYREVLQLREIDGFSYEEIRELTGLDLPYIRVLLSRSRQKVRDELEKIYNYERGTYESAGKVLQG